MNYRHRFVVKAPLTKVTDFHSRSSSMPEITPPPLRIKLHQSPEVLRDGDEMDFSLEVGPISIHWVAKIEGVSSSGFSDRQLIGPFALWVHKHTFTALDHQNTQVIDEISLTLSSHPGWWIAGLGLFAGLPLLFAYRGYKTRRILQ